MKKYELVKEDSIDYGDISGPMYRIRALIDIPEYAVQAGDLGGYVNGEENLSHEGNCWIGEDAIVQHKSLVCENALVTEHVFVTNGSVISGNARIEGYVNIMSGEISGDTRLHSPEPAQADPVLDFGLRGAEITDISPKNTPKP